MVKLSKPNTPDANFTRPALLLHPNIPKPMHGTNPRSVMGKEWWDVVRKEAQVKNNFHCWSCGVHRSKARYHKWLEGHESYKINYEKGVMQLEEIVSLCHCCHNYIHDGRMRSLLDTGKREMTRSKYEYIINHGNNVISPLPDSILRASTYEGYFAPWKDWHLLIEGKKFYSKFKNQAEWMRFYG